MLTVETPLPALLQLLALPMALALGLVAGLALCAWLLGRLVLALQGR
jgi:hypothetical protein